jgi:hypothetical protein
MTIENKMGMLYQESAVVVYNGIITMWGIIGFFVKDGDKVRLANYQEINRYKNRP